MEQELRLRNKSRLLREQEYCLQGTNLVDTRNKKICEEQISSTLGSRIKISLTQGTKKYVQWTNLVYPGNKTIVSEEQISSTTWNKNWVWGTNLVNTGNKNKDLVNIGNKKVSRNKSHLPWEQEYCVWGTNLVYYMEQELRPRNKSRQHREQE
jgi:hypothetical protein